MLPCLRLRRVNSPPDYVLTLLSPLAFALNLDPGAIDQKVQRVLRAAVRDVDLQGQAGLDRGIAIVTLSAARACRRSLPDHGGIKPAYRRLRAIARRPIDRQRAAPLQRFALGGPVPGLVGGGVGLRIPSSYHTGFTR